MAFKIKRKDPDASEVERMRKALHLYETLPGFISAKALEQRFSCGLDTMREYIRKSGKSAKTSN